MDGHYCLRPLRYRLFNSGYVDVQGIGLNVYEDRLRADITDRFGGCREGIGCRDNLVPATDIGDNETQM